MAIADKLAALRVKANLIADRQIGLMDIEVDVHDGMAVLSGDVDTEDQKQLAEELAYRIDGILEVENEIRVGALAEAGSIRREDANLGYGLTAGDVGDTVFSISDALNAPGPGIAASEQFPGQFTDHEIEHHVCGRLASQDQVDVSDIWTHCTNRIVHVTGSVPHADDLNKLQDIIISARGVMGVDSRVSVRAGEPGTRAN